MPLYAIGDIHGYTAPLQRLLSEMAPAHGDTIIFLGDYVDKGPDVAGTLDFLISLSRQVRCIFLRGNHDQLLLDAYRDPACQAYWECLAGEAPLSSYGSGSTQALLADLPLEHVHFLEKICRDYYTTEDFINAWVSAMA